MSRFQGEKYKWAIGIDIGSTYSCVGVWKDGKVEIASNEYGNRITPSCVSFTEREVLIGESALYQASRNPENTIYCVKRLLGRKFDHPEVQQELESFPYKVINRQGMPVIEVNFKGKTELFRPEEIVALLVKYMKGIAEKYLGQTVEKAVVTLPATWNNLQRQATKKACEIAGIKVNEATCAGFYYGTNRFNVDVETGILVFDLGGGTLDVSVMITESGICDVKAANGQKHLGGEDFVTRMVDYYVREFLEEHGIDIDKNQKAHIRLRRECEKAKRNLSSQQRTNISIENLVEGIDLRKQITRDHFVELCEDLFQKCMLTVDELFKQTHRRGFLCTTREEITHVLLVGGSSRIPRIQQLIKEAFPDRTICRGVNPDEAIAFGATIQAGVLTAHSNCFENYLLLDVMADTVGIETATVLMGRYNQPSVTVQVFEGCNKFTRDNVMLGRFVLTNIPLAPKGVPKIEITFNVDADGILTVYAKELSTQKSSVELVVRNLDENMSKEKIKEIAKRNQVIVRDQDVFERVKYLIDLAEELGNERVEGETVATLDIQVGGFNLPIFRTFLIL